MTPFHIYHMEYLFGLLLLSQFKITMDVLKSLNLNISVWHNDTFGRNSFLGEVELDLSEWDFSNTQINEYVLKSRVKALFCLESMK